MSAAETQASVLAKQQSKLPSSMRYERVHEILSTDPALKSHLGPRNQQIDSRFGEKLMFSKEVVEVTNTIHAEGRDAHKVPKSDVLRVAMRVVNLLPGNGAAKVLLTPPASLPAANPAKKRTKKQKAKVTKAKIKKPVIAAKTAKTAKTTPTPAPKPKVREKEEPVESDETAPPVLPDSELPPERQPLRLPPGFDPSKYPHYDVQSSVYALLLTALTCATHFEKLQGYEERQKALEAVLKMYLSTCVQIQA